MEKFLFYIQQRRVWAGIIGVIAFFLSSLGYTSTLDTVSIIDALVAVGKGLGALIPALLALWSFINPKK